MSAKVQTVYNDVMNCRSNAKQFTSVAQLLEHYPRLMFHDGNLETWHDLVKQTTPLGIKNSLKYNRAELMPLIDKELEYLLKIHNWVVKILIFVTANRNKALFLKVLEMLEGVSLNTGGGISPAVARVVLIYEQEGNVKAKKRKAGEGEEEDNDDEPFAPAVHAVIPAALPDDLDMDMPVFTKAKKFLEYEIIQIPDELEANREIIELYNSWRDSSWDLTALTGAAVVAQPEIDYESDSDADFIPLLADLVNYEDLFV